MIRGVLILLLALARVAHAENPALSVARRAVADVRYDDARGLLVEALAAGGCRPEEVIEIYELSAATAVVLGQSELAQQYYRRMLALDPEAKLPAGASPRLQQPFMAARAYMAAQGRLDVRARRAGTAIEVTIAADPLRMVAAVAAIVARVGGAAGTPAPPKLAVTGQPLVFDPGGAITQIVALDEHNNVLRVIAAPELAPDVARELAGPADPGTPILRSWLTWAIPAVVVAGTGVGFLVDAQHAKTELDAILATDQTHFFNDAEQQRERWKSHTLIAQVAFGAAAALAVTAIVMAVTRPRTISHVAIVPRLGGDQLGLVVGAKF